ncbi:putative Biogenesis of lysosome-related organelles complex 1 subunit 1 [Hypsibius exemplaris]|uniref:Biogenesis of lysosome-related organelles complex 1 subunit 1 n=1 Tax=Hypsibius exemplaris TaxID=2072580 RepID=A0A9X6NDK5_HYPEX|nr:putative Biogenesis of lysosome-related organelles complex 1 subunit 1 [Hypsibius exemplaris]
MLSNIIRDHQARQKYHKEISERKRKDAMDVADHLTKVLVTSLNTSVAQAYVNQRRIDAEAKALQVRVNRFTQQTQQWLQIADSSTAPQGVGRRGELVEERGARHADRQRYPPSGI